MLSEQSEVRLVPRYVDLPSFNPLLLKPLRRSPVPLVLERPVLLLYLKFTLSFGDLSKLVTTLY